MDSLKKIGSKSWAVLDAVGQQSNKLANKLGAEAFWPMPLDKECEKAAAILSAFTRDGLQVKRNGNNTKSFVKIPPKILQQAMGLVIFTVFRTGFHISGASGSGILIARQADGSWGPPSGILLHTLGIGFMIGIDVYDTILVLRTPEAIQAFTRPKLSLGAELSVAAGPLGSGKGLDMGFNDKSPAWMYVKSKGLYAGIALDGTIVIERGDENEKYYGRRVMVTELTGGRIPLPHDRPGLYGLVATIEMAEGKANVREDLIPYGSPPSELARPPVISVNSQPSTSRPIASISTLRPGSQLPPLPPRRSQGSIHSLSFYSHSPQPAPAPSSPPHLVRQNDPFSDPLETHAATPPQQPFSAQIPLDNPPPYSDIDIPADGRDRRTG